ncbi:hypothetical protein BD413DRAFT_510594 [Trametes elegans]|nr:hypothetical protein BD413DRAFT_510594 [Trametes elegans]
MTATVEAPHAVWLKPRPLARCPSSFMMLPLLPSEPASKPLPPEVWSDILAHVFAFYRPRGEFADADAARLRMGLLLISKEIHGVAQPLFYAHIHVSSMRGLEKLATHLHKADQQWDSIRRIPYSAPGRWIQTVDMSALKYGTPEHVFWFDALLYQLLALVPFMAHLIASPRCAFSRRSLFSLADREGAGNLRTLKGVQLKTDWRADEDAFVALLRACPRLEELEVYGTGVDAPEVMAGEGAQDPPLDFRPLHLPRLRRLVVLTMPTSPTLRALLFSPLPALRHLTLTPYDEQSVSASLIPRFITTHGALLTSLHMHNLNQWPLSHCPSPRDLLETCPALHHLSLELPLPDLKLSKEHQLEILSVAHPKPEFLILLERLLPKLPKLRFVRVRDVKWLRGGMSTRAQHAGVQGEMQLWKRKLNRRRIQMLDAEWKTGAE